MVAPITASTIGTNDALILYQGDIVRYGRQPNNFGPLADANVEARGDSPICGDHMTLYLDFHAAGVRGAAFTSSACCAVCKASASMMTDAMKNQSLIGVHLLRRAFLRMIERGEAAPSDRTVLGPLTVFERLRHIPSRVECALLPWTTLETALGSSIVVEPRSATVIALRRP